MGSGIQLAADKKKFRGVFVRAIGLELCGHHRNFGEGPAIRITDTAAGLLEPGSPPRDCPKELTSDNLWELTEIRRTPRAGVGVAGDFETN